MWFLWFLPPSPASGWYPEARHPPAAVRLVEGADAGLLFALRRQISPCLEKALPVLKEADRNSSLVQRSFKRRQALGCCVSLEVKKQKGCYFFGTGTGQKVCLCLSWQKRRETSLLKTMFSLVLPCPGLNEWEKRGTNVEGEKRYRPSSAWLSSWQIRAPDWDTRAAASSGFICCAR